MKRTSILICLIGLLSACTERFSEYPPDKFLTNEEETALNMRFINYLYDSLGDERNFNREEEKQLQEIFRLEYFVREGDESYFMISENRKSIFGSGFTCYAGKFEIVQGDTVFHLKFKTDSFRDPQGKNTKIQFDSLLLK
jgi:hypothetical protein